MLTPSRPLDTVSRPVTLPIVSELDLSQGLPFALLFAARKTCFPQLESGMTSATANGTTSNDGSEEFDWIDDDR
jgi:hypothetical protein